MKKYFQIPKILNITGILITLAFQAMFLMADGVERLPSEEIKPYLDHTLKGLVESNGLGELAAGVISNGHEETLSYGKAEGVKQIFEIASATKTFTVLLLAELAREGIVKLDDPLRMYLPAGTKVPSQGGREITLFDLATHTSGLPRNYPRNALYTPRALQLGLIHLIHFDFSMSLRGLNDNDLVQCLSWTQLTAPPGETWNYSNFGMSLLGLALVRATGSLDYESLVRRKIAEPLNMKSVWVNFPSELKAYAIQDYDGHGNAVASEQKTPFDGALALHSNLDDLMTYLRFNLGAYRNSLPGLYEAVQKTHKIQRTVKGRPLPLAWWTEPKSGMLYHSGSIGGFRSWIGFMEKEQAGLILLSNSSNEDIFWLGPELLKRIAGFDEGFVPFSNSVMLSMWFQGEQMTAAQVKSLNENLERDPEDITSRRKLMFYGLFHPSQFQSEYYRHYLWLAEKHPESPLLFIRFGGQDEGKMDFQKEMGFWELNTRIQPKSIPILANAESFYENAGQLNRALVLLLKLGTLDAKEAEWNYRQADTLLQMATLSGKARSTEDKKMAAEAYKQYEAAFRKKGKAPDFRYPRRVFALYNAGEKLKAKQLADSFLNKVSDNSKNSLYASTAEAWTVLGLLAVDEGDFERAKECLAELMKEKYGAISNSFGPNIVLPQALLDAGESESVLKFLKAYSEVIKSDPAHSKIKEWISEIKKGKHPALKRLN